MDGVTVSGTKSGNVVVSTAGSSNVTLKNSTHTLTGATEYLNFANIAGLTIGPNVTVSGDGYDAQAVYISACSDVLTIDGLTMTSTWPLKINASTLAIGSEIRNLSVDGARATAIFLVDTSGLDIVSPCTFANSAQSTAIDIGGTSNDIEIMGCTFNAGGGILLQDTANNINIQRNSIIGATSKGFMTQEASHDTIFSHNLVKNCGEVGVQNGGVNYHGTGHNHLASHNLLINNAGYNLSFHDTTHGWAYNNTSTLGGAIAGVDSFNGGFSVSSTGANATTSTGWTIKNNVSYNDGRADIPSLRLSTAAIPITALDYNLWYRASDPEDLISLDNNGTRITWTTYHTTNGNEPHSISADPLFVNPATEDFHLQAGSPLINAGVRP
jgi:hypothetical protein